MKKPLLSLLRVTHIIINNREIMSKAGSLSNIKELQPPPPQA